MDNQIYISFNTSRISPDNETLASLPKLETCLILKIEIPMLKFNGIYPNKVVYNSSSLIFKSLKLNKKKYEVGNINNIPSKPLIFYNKNYKVEPKPLISQSTN